MSTLKMGAGHPSKTLEPIYKTTTCQKPQDHSKIFIAMKTQDLNIAYICASKCNVLSSAYMSCAQNKSELEYIYKILIFQLFSRS